MGLNRRLWFEQYADDVPRELPVPGKSMIDVFEDTVQRCPDLPAVHYFDQSISFAQLNHYANCLATRFMDWGIGLGDRVALFLQNDPEFLIAQYAAWKRGAVVVPLNPMFKEKELRYHLNDSDTRVLVCLRSLYSDAVRELIRDSRVEHVVLTEGPDSPFPPSIPTSHDGVTATVNLSDILVTGQSNPAARRHVNVDDVAYLVYTSGTTGEPKGAMNLHRNLSHNAEVYRQWMDIVPSDVILGVAPLFHVTGIVGHSALSALAGVPLVLFHRFEAGTALAMIRKWKPTMTAGAITAFIAMLNHSDRQQTDFSSLVKCYSGGAAIPEGILDQFQRDCGIYIHNIYGLTETNSPTHAVPLGRRAPVDPDSGAVSIGVPVPNCDAKIVALDDPDQQVKPGEQGELAVRGPMVFVGYWGKPEATQKAFHDGYFLTGDVAVMDESGWFFIVDRKKDLINVSGFKVWPRDVEDVLYQHPAVKEAAVIGVPDAYRGETVRAFVALKESYVGQVTSDELILFCKEKMPAYKYPRIVTFLSEVPKTATGKFLRRALQDVTHDT